MFRHFQTLSQTNSYAYLNDFGAVHMLHYRLKMYGMLALACGREINVTHFLDEPHNIKVPSRQAALNAFQRKCHHEIIVN